VSVILDGENAWEYYRQNGVPFLRRLYRELAQTPWIRTTTISDYLDSHPDLEPIERLFAGSWIRHNFYIWIGHEEDRTAWDYLYRTRSMVRSTVKSLGPEAFTPPVRDALFAAEGSDWFWWYGDDHSSGHDEEFDALFRAHLANRLPTGFVRPSLEGRPVHYFEWTGAGVYTSDRAQGAVSRSSRSLVRTIHFGFDPATLFLRFDARGAVRREMKETDEVDVTFVRPVPCHIHVQGVGRRDGGPAAVLSSPAGEVLLRAAADQVLEIACSFEELGFEQGADAEFYVEIRRDGHFLERHPQYGTILFRIPTQHFEREQWQV
jgi:hypothetical protein